MPIKTTDPIDVHRRTRPQDRRIIRQNHKPLSHGNNNMTLIHDSSGTLLNVEILSKWTNFHCDRFFARVLKFLFYILEHKFIERSCRACPEPLVFQIWRRYDKWFTFYSEKTVISQRFCHWDKVIQWTFV